ncbi:molybdopterin converting factor small subunit [Nocardioides cavernae]|uniref:Molybdopterin converting factor small subunit n=1 Tax=Nocardioides cavernae TaxID=1921566 RepID=A0A7Y9KNM8_9ACTN|nr:MoaD/ThiS family protein [Nocardioides cavernae]NYE35891.1 molybdopterin converting factor small subunit [Nocardioides cavernae]
MSDSSGEHRTAETAVTVRYWAGARAAAGVAEDVLEATPGLTLADVVALVLERHPGDRMARTVGVCSVLIGEQPVGARDPAYVAVPPGSVVELLPPFAGG